jgi:hypothetical protein
MIINPFIFGGGSDPDAEAYFARIVTAGSTIDATAQAAINDFCVGCKDDSIWTLLLDIGPLCGSDLTAALIKLKKLSSGWSYTNNNFTGGDYSQATGLTGNGTTTYLATGVLGTDMTFNSTGIGFYNRTTVSAGPGGCEAGATASSSSELNLYAPYYGDDHVYSDHYDDAHELDGGVISGAPGFIFGTRPASNEHTAYRNGSALSTRSTLGGTLPSSELTFFRINGRINFSNDSLAFLHLTLGMTSTQAAAFYTRVQALQTALGRNV